MSYEGYDVWYCPKGHRVGTFGSGCCFPEDQAEEISKCEVCEEKASTMDVIDETNGCYCDSMTEEDKKKYGKCPAHETVETVLGYDSMPCQCCKGTGKKEVTVAWGWKPCTECATALIVCDKCKGRKEVPVPKETQEVQCSCCCGSGDTPQPRYDISHLLERDRKRQEKEKELREQYYLSVSISEVKAKGCWEEFYKEMELDKWPESLEELEKEDCKFTLTEEQAKRYGFVEEESREEV